MNEAMKSENQMLIWRKQSERLAARLNLPTGAVDLGGCSRYCRCGTCDLCGFAKHMAIHGPCYGEAPGSRPWGHIFIPKLLVYEGETE